MTMQMSVQCPPGVSAGSMVRITDPSGQQLDVVVPAGITEGMSFQVQVAPPPGAARTTAPPQFQENAAAATRSSVSLDEESLRLAEPATPIPMLQLNGETVSAGDQQNFVAPSKRSLRGRSPTRLRPS